jgi:hypothetical protein
MAQKSPRQMFGKVKALVLCISTIGLAACSGTPELTNTQQTQFVSHRVDIGGADWRENRALIDLFAQEGPYQWVEVRAPSAGDGQVVARWLNEDGIQNVRPDSTGKPGVVTLIGYWPHSRATAPQ